YLRSIELCREYGIYRQSWCGCRLAPDEERNS
ncbi:MAG: epoxyqueuosine reductase QueH, partial [Oscillospiraceae bacterium]|nr:epoxyqueuosine reductase QueH [Oscillospiraceae bacterium]